MRDETVPITQADAICEGIGQAMEEDERVVLIGEGVTDPKAIFGTTNGLREKFGSSRVFDSPLSENGMTGVCIGAALSGLRPILVHQRIDFGLLAMDQIVNNAAKWRYMFAGQVSVPIVMRFIIGRGWGPGPQHSQSLQALFAHIPGLKVVMPVSGYDAKGMLIEAIRDDNPVLFLEHRWLQGIKDKVPRSPYTVALNKALVCRTGTDVTVVAFSHMVVESLMAADALAMVGISMEVIDARTVRPLDMELIAESSRKTGHLIVADTGWKTGGIASEVITGVVERDYHSLKKAPIRITLPDLPVPTSPHLTKSFYPDALFIARSACKLLNSENVDDLLVRALSRNVPHDIPFLGFNGPF